MILDDSRHIKVSYGNPRFMVKLMFSVIMNKNFPHRKYIKYAVSGVSDQGAFVMNGGG